MAQSLVHNHWTRWRNVRQSFCRLSQKSFRYCCTQFFDALPEIVRCTDLNNFKTTIKMKTIGIRNLRYADIFFYLNVSFFMFSRSVNISCTSHNKSIIIIIQLFFLNCKIIRSLFIFLTLRHLNISPAEHTSLILSPSTILKQVSVWTEDTQKDNSINNVRDWNNKKHSSIYFYFCVCLYLFCNVTYPWRFILIKFSFVVYLYKRRILTSVFTSFLFNYEIFTLFF